MTGNELNMLDNNVVRQQQHPHKEALPKDYIKLCKYNNLSKIHNLEIFEK